MNVLAFLILILAVYIHCWFLVSLWQKRNDVADSAWGLGFVLLAWSAYWLGQSQSVPALLISVLVTIWGVRLSWHVSTRNRKKGEDSRYLAWRKQWGSWVYLRSYLQVFLLQGALLLLVAIPIILANTTPRLHESWRWFSALGIALWLLGFSFEVVGDAQLQHFTQDPSNKGKLLQTGLWAYTRHPNYFGEVTLWWGIGVIAAGSTANPFAFLGPLVISVLILFVSGVPLLEKQYAGRPDFEDYKRRTSVFFPAPPKHQ